MKELWLLRHAHAEPYASDATDFARRLDARGQSEAAAIGRLAITLGLDFDLIVSSPAARTLATAKAVAGAQGARSIVREDATIYLADRKALVAIVRNLPADCDRALLVGHNPGISRLAGWATDDERLEELRPATLVGTRADIDRWSDADQGLFERVRLLRPEDASR